MISTLNDSLTLNNIIFPNVMQSIMNRLSNPSSLIGVNFSIAPIVSLSPLFKIFYNMNLSLPLNFLIKFLDVVKTVW